MSRASLVRFLPMMMIVTRAGDGHTGVVDRGMVMGASESHRRTARAALSALTLLLAGSPGCHQIPVVGQIDTHTAFRGQTDVAAQVTASVRGPIEVRVPPATDPGPMVAVQ